MMRILITYDVSTITKQGKRRLRRVARACKDYGKRVQFSVFECDVNELEWSKLRRRLLSEYDQAEDSLRFYFLDQNAMNRTEHHGVREPIDFDGPLIA